MQVYHLVVVNADGSVKIARTEVQDFHALCEVLDDFDAKVIATGESHELNEMAIIAHWATVGINAYREANKFVWSKEVAPE